MGKSAAPPKFDGLMNYQLWRTRLEDYLVSHDLWEAIEPDFLTTGKGSISNSASKKKLVTPIQGEELLNFSHFECVNIRLCIHHHIIHFPTKVMGPPRFRCA
jgi:hypothetical protein